jgi:tRNA pseudouridine55 synthase
MSPGIYLLHKAEGPTSFSVVQECMKGLMARPERRLPRICHGGTLDPFASGLLLILVEPATKLFDYLHAVPKVYEATVKWGIETDNGDPGGKIISTGDSSELSIEKLEASLAAFSGWQEQIPHATSAKRVGGERAYLKAHRGEEIVMPPSRVYLHEAQWLGHDLPAESRLRITVRGGYYVRAMVRDLGRMMGCGAHVSALHRSAIGPWVDPGVDNVVEVHGRDVLPWVRRRELSDFEVGELRHEKEIERGEVLAADWELPTGFPEGDELVVRGFHLEKFCYLLGAGAEGKLKVVSELRGGV